MADPFTIRIYAPDGDPEGVRIIDRMNWTGVGVGFALQMIGVTLPLVVFSAWRAIVRRDRIG